MSPSVVSGEGDGLLVAEEEMSSPLCCKGLVVVVVLCRGDLSRIDALLGETGVTVLLLLLSKRGNFQWREACNSLSWS